MKRKEKRGSKSKNDVPTYHAYKIYSLTIKNRIKEASSIINDSMMMCTTMNDYAYNIINIRTRCIFVNCKVTTIIGIARPNELVINLKDVALNNQIEFRMNFEWNEVQKLEGGDGERKILNIRISSLEKWLLSLYV